MSTSNPLKRALQTLSHVPYFSGLEQAVQIDIARNAIRRDYQSEEAIFWEGDEGSRGGYPTILFGHPQQMKRFKHLLFLSALLLAGCQAQSAETAPAGMGMGPGDEIWALIAYVRALGQGQVQPRGPMGGLNNPAAQATQQAEMLAKAISLGVISQAEAYTFSTAHAALDGLLAANPGAGNAAARQSAGPSTLVETGVLTQTQANTFLAVHDRLMEAGLMR